MTARALVSALLLTATITTVAPAAERTRLILGFDLSPLIWTLKGRAKLLPTLGPIALYSVTGRITCFDDDAGLCPGRRGRAEGVLQGTGDLTLTARLGSGATCVFTGSLNGNQGSYSCTDRDGNVVLEETLHVGLCRCYVRGGGPAAACNPNFCPF